MSCEQASAGSALSGSAYFKAKYEEYSLAVNAALKEALSGINCHEKLLESMSYSVNAGGKRMRPILFFAALDGLNIDYKKYYGFGAALELLHTYSLIHDDMPCMDNDDYRRGKLTNHKVFGEAFALLSGDALLNLAYETSLGNVSNKSDLAALKEFASLAGARGMINGQAYDLDENKHNDEATLTVIDENKTGKLLTAPFTMASLIAGGKNFNEYKTLGETFGKLFQWTDDLLDVKSSFEKMGKTPGKDKVQGKVTAVSVYGEKVAEKMVQNAFTSCIKICKIIDGGWFFEDYFKIITERLG